MHIKIRILYFLIAFISIRDVSTCQIPRSKKDADKPGNYEVVFRVSNTHLYKKDSLIVNLFFTGYGRIGNSKLFIIPSDLIFTDTCILHAYLTINPGHLFHWGDIHIPYLSNLQFETPLNGPSVNDSTWSYPTLFIDGDSIPYNYPLITETFTGTESPYQFHYKIRPNAPSGDYNIKIYFTYYNSQEWKTSQAIIPIHINNFLEQYPVGAWAIGIIVAVIGLIGIIPIIIGGVNWLQDHNFYRKKITLVENRKKQSDNSKIVKKRG